MSMEELLADKHHVHDVLLNEFQLLRGELSLILNLSIFTFAFPIQLLCRYFGARLTNRKFYLANADYLDLIVFFLVCYLWEVVVEYENKPVGETLFGPDED